MTTNKHLFFGVLLSLVISISNVAAADMQDFIMFNQMWINSIEDTNVGFANWKRIVNPALAL